MRLKNPRKPVVRPSSEKINSATAVLIGHATRRTKKGQNGLETHPALSGPKALEEGPVRQSSGPSEGLAQQGAPSLGLGSVFKLTRSKRASAAVQLRATRIFLEIIMRSAGLWDPAPSRWR